jgi:hypothetical protein
VKRKANMALVKVVESVAGRTAPRHRSRWRCWRRSLPFGTTKLNRRKRTSARSR